MPPSSPTPPASGRREHENPRAYFREVGGATATDHGHPSAATADLDRADAERLYAKVRSGDFTAAEAELFRAQMLTEMARMSLDDGMTLQIHPGVYRNHHPQVMQRFGRDKIGRASCRERGC